MKWLLGFLLGAIGGFALGCAVGPALWGRTSAEAHVSSAWRRSVGPRVGGRGGSGILPDEQLTRTISGRLATRGLHNPHVDVTTVDEVVYLRGRVRDAAERAALVEAVRGTPGVRDVVDELKEPESA